MQTPDSRIPPIRVATVASDLYKCLLLSACGILNARTPSVKKGITMLLRRTYDHFAAIWPVWV